MYNNVETTPRHIHTYVFNYLEKAPKRWTSAQMHVLERRKRQRPWTCNAPHRCELDASLHVSHVIFKKINFDKKYFKRFCFTCRPLKNSTTHTIKQVLLWLPSKQIPNYSHLKQKSKLSLNFFNLPSCQFIIFEEYNLCTVFESLHVRNYLDFLQISSSDKQAHTCIHM